MMRDVRSGKLDNKQLYEVEKTVEQLAKLINENYRGAASSFVTSVNVSNFKLTPNAQSPREEEEDGYKVKAQDLIKKKMKKRNDLVRI
jgi:hypothetical protein